MDVFKDVGIQMKIRVQEQMRKVEAGMPLHLAAAEIGLMPFELQSLARQIP